ncbi:PREDICTED: IQ and AAA domain-containing protein 1 [Condylura cristata]|uniref:IQ and AAA domain-containing protein 1 n=1 Tax=Condylura cristata TaxID=143302 RepID=UPI000642B158|nr:PREDICTED: IQ and AAA domain-containing protein 1 [Condylura cristata]
MSNAMYNTMWHQTQEALNSLLVKESQKMLEPQSSPVFIFQMLATFYIKYVQIFRSMESVYDQIVHPQKRILVRKMLDGVMGRILELKSELVELELSEFHYFDDILQDLKLLPQQLDIPIPKYFLKEKSDVIKGREKILSQIITSSGLDLPGKKYSLKPMSLEDAVKLIQVAERARQGRLRALFMKQIFLREFRAKQARLLGDKMADTGAAALRIQKVWRGFHQCKLTEKEREKEMIFLGMTPPPLFNGVSATMIQAEKVAYLRSELQLKHEESYREALVTIKDDLKLTEGADIKENLQEQIRRWFIECRNLTGDFPQYPEVEEGGSAIIFSNKTPQQVPAVGGWFCPHTVDIWKNKDESWNFAQGHDPELIKEEKRRELESEIRLQVDELMRQELKNLKLAVNKEKENPVKAKKKGDKKKNQDKKGKRGKDKDLTADRTIESLYKELVEEGLLIQNPKVNLSEYIGSAAVHEKAPLVRSLLLAGPAGVGKKMLIHAICTETGANLFNLSATNIAGKYPGKNGLQMMLHLVVKLEPKRLKKQLPKVLKLLRPDDRILIVGTTRRPFDAELQSFCKFYQKIILVPRPDYASRYVLWKEIIQHNGGVLSNSLNVSCLAKVTDGFTPGHMVHVAQSVLTERRLRQQPHKPLTAGEFISALTSMEPVYQEEEDSFKDWYAKTPMGKKRALALTGGKAEKEKEKGKKKKAKPGKKKK